MAKIFYGWWRKHQLLMDVRMMERMVRILTFLLALVLFIKCYFIFLNFALILWFVCVLDYYEKGKPGVGGLP